MVNAAELISRIRQRKQELKTWEWWDTKVSNRVYHPSKYADDFGTQEPVASLNLTRDERKRQRKLKRADAREDERKRIELGISKPPPPKLSRRNVAAVYGAAYIQDPTKYELIAIEAEKERAQAHIAANEERRLSADEKWEKRKHAVEAHRQDALHCAAYYFSSALDTKGQFIVDYTAKKFLCSGAGMLSDQDAFVIIESGEPEIRKFTKLITQKLNGSIIWTGQLLTPNFKRWSIHTTPKRWEFLKVYGVESLYEQATGDYGPSIESS